MKLGEFGLKKSLFLLLLLESIGLEREIQIVNLFLEHVNVLVELVLVGQVLELGSEVLLDLVVGGLHADDFV